MRCLKCGADNPAGARFCLQCGVRLVVACPQCGCELPPEARFCTTCGASLQAARPDPLAAALQRLVPKEYAERLQAARGAAGRERRLVTILFSDIKGYSTIAEHLDPEDVLGIVNGAFEFLIPPIYRYEGTLTQLMGDAILAFFGAPIAHEDDPERACRAALEIIAGSRAYAARLERERGIRGFAVRVGMHTGLVVTGEVGTDLRMAYTAVGDTINLAARMEAAAEPGTVLLSGETQRLIAPLFETRSLGSVEVKNRAEPVPVYRLLASKAGHGKAYGIQGLQSPLVGREAELRLLQEATGRLRAGVGGIVTVVGEAGLGKSRLVAEARGCPSGSAVRWLEGRCLSYGGTIAYLLWLDVLRGLLGVTEDQAPAEVLQRLRLELPRLCPQDHAGCYPYLARLLSLPLEPEAEVALHALSGEQLKAGTFRALELLLAGAARQRPLVLVCEDLHWADPTSLELLERVLALSDRASLLVICVMRPERAHGCWRLREAAGRDHPHRHTDLSLAPISSGEGEALLGNLLGEGGLPAELRQRILERAEGNPFYMEEILRALIDSGAIARDGTGGGWHTTCTAAEIAIPDTLQGALAARIDRLQDDARRILRLASVIGRVFLRRVLAQIAQEERDLDGQLVALQREEMIRERARLPEMEYIFKHYLTQEAAYNGLLKQERRACHRQVAEALEKLFPEQRAEMAGLLAHHWERTEEPEQAVRYLLQAGDQARLLYAHAEATGFYERALALVRQQGNPERTARTLLKLGLTYHTAFDYARARQAYDEGFALWRQAARDACDLPPARDALRLPLEIPVQELDPHRAFVTSSVWAVTQLFRGLVELTPELDVVPDLAERWEVLAGGRRYRFHLRTDACWSDGAPLTAGDFEFAWKRLLDPATASPNAGYLFELQNGRAFHEGRLADPAQVGVRAEDAHTLAVDLEEPAGEFLTLLAHSATFALPRHAVQAHGAAWTEAGRVVTSGPFCLESWEREGALVLARNPAYRGRRRGNVGRLELTFPPAAYWHGGQWSDLLAMYTAGSQHLLRLPQLPPGELARLAQRAGEYVSYQALGVTYLGIVPRRPPFGDPRVRRALAMAVDRSALPAVAHGHYVQATGGFVPPGMPGHSPAIALPFDPTQARCLLAEAGYPGGVGFPELHLYSLALYGGLAPALQAQWREHLGIGCAWEVFANHEVLDATMRGRRPDAFTMGWTADYPDPDNFLAIGITQPGTGWRHEGYERLVREAERTIDQAERIRLYQQADRLLVQEAAIVPLDYHRQHYLVKPWLKPAILAPDLGAMKDTIIEPHE